MTVTQSRELRRSRKLRVLRLVSANNVDALRDADTAQASVQEIRRAMREWGALPIAWRLPD